MIDNQTIYRESSLPILTTEATLEEKKCRWALCSKLMGVAVGILVLLGFVSLLNDSSYIDVDEIIAASMLMPSSVIKWFQSIDPQVLVNRTWPLVVIAGIILFVVKLKKPSKD